MLDNDERVANRLELGGSNVARLLQKVIGGDEATGLITPTDLRLFSYSHQRRCCICRNSAQN